MNPVNISFSPELLLTPLHWMIADKKRTIVVEPLKDGIRVYDDPVGVMTNNPTFDQQMFHLSNYMHLSNKPVTNTFAKGLEITEYSRGMGAMGMPGDLSSASRFVKAAFTCMNSVSGNSEEERVSQFFHILGSVEQQRGNRRRSIDSVSDDQRTADTISKLKSRYIPVCRYVPAWANTQVPKTVDMFLSGIGRTGMRYVSVISFPRVTSRPSVC